MRSSNRLLLQRVVGMALLLGAASCASLACQTAGTPVASTVADTPPAPEHGTQPAAVRISYRGEELLLLGWADVECVPSNSCLKEEDSNVQAYFVLYGLKGAGFHEAQLIPWVAFDSYGTMEQLAKRHGKKLRELRKLNEGPTHIDTIGATLRGCDSAQREWILALELNEDDERELLEELEPREDVTFSESILAEISIQCSDGKLTGFQIREPWVGHREADHSPADYERLEIGR